MPEDLKLWQIGSSQLPPPFRGLHSPGLRKHCQIIFAVISGNRLLTCCVGHEHIVLCLCSYQLICCVGHEHIQCCVLVTSSSDLLCGSWTHCVVYPYQVTCCVGHEHTVLCVLINWPAVWVMNTLCCVSLSTDLLCGSWTQCVVCPYQLTCCVGHEHSVLCFPFL